MAADSKKFLWITLSLGIFVLILVVAGLLLFRPTGNPADNTGQSGGTPPKSADPQDYLVSAPPSPPDSGTTTGGDSYITYGTPMEPSSTTIQRVTEGTIPVPAPATSSTIRQVPTTTTTLSPYAPVSSSPGTSTTYPEPTTTTTVRIQVTKPVTTTKPPSRPRPTTTTTTIRPLASSQAVEDAITWIQVGSFPARASADKLRDAYTASGISSVIMVNDIDGTSWYRVRVGPFSSRSQAREWMDRVKAVPGASKNPFLASD